MDITRWSTPKSNWLYSLQPKMEKLYTVSKNKVGADCGSDHELLIAKFKLKLKKVGKTTRPFRYDLNQIPYDYTVEVRNRFKVLHWIDRVPYELWTEVRDIVQGQGSRPSPWKRNAERQNGCRRRPHKQLWKEEKGKAKGAKERYSHLNAEFQRIAREIKKPSSAISARK